MGGQFLAEAGAGAPRQERRQREGAAVVLLDVAVQVGLRDLGDGRAGLGEPAHQPDGDDDGHSGGRDSVVGEDAALLLGA